MCQKGKIKKFYWINIFSHENLILLRYTAMHGTRKLGFKLCSWVNTVNKYLWENHDLHIQILWVSLSDASAFYQLPWCRFGVFIVNFEHISHLCSSVSIVNFEHEIASWFVSKKNNAMNLMLVSIKTICLYINILWSWKSVMSKNHSRTLLWLSSY